MALSKFIHKNADILLAGGNKIYDLLAFHNSVKPKFGPYPWKSCCFPAVPDLTNISLHPVWFKSPKPDSNFAASVSCRKSASKSASVNQLRKDELLSYQAELMAYSRWIDEKLVNADDRAKYLPIGPEEDDLYNKCRDGILYCKLINICKPGAIKENFINTNPNLGSKQSRQNLLHALMFAFTHGCDVNGLTLEDLEAGTPHDVVTLLGQIIMISFADTTKNRLLMTVISGYVIPERRLSPENFLIAWVNYHLSRSGCDRMITNLNTEMRDSIAYIHLLKQISPLTFDVNINTFQNLASYEDRARILIEEAKKIQCGSFVSPEDIINANPRLNQIFVANLFASVRPSY